MFRKKLKEGDGVWVKSLNCPGILDTIMYNPYLPWFISSYRVQVRQNDPNGECEHLDRRELRKLKEDTYKCPHCGVFCGDGSKVLSSDPQFKSAPDPYYYWTEIHYCPNCHKYYFIINGT